eukprot:TRINITY_DN12940_c0_g3_i1.p1 TRINITY_DN12940_c0_g3~~TRINITY_DN12940_c0_g3_i1.p1  ORF type:complete len:874 (-),score=183.43 TRINITY_DN12940_c0_g3_i1:57-2579(-)
MAKLFEEVLNGTTQSADLLISFAYPGVGLSAASDCPPGQACAGGGSAAALHGGAVSSAAGHHAGGIAGSPRPTAGGGLHADESVGSPRLSGSTAARGRTSGACCSAAGSPMRCSGGDYTPAQGQPASIRCHSLILRTQPTLLQTLLAHGVRNGSMACGGSMQSSACDASEEDAAAATGAPCGAGGCGCGSATSAGEEDAVACGAGGGDLPPAGVSSPSSAAASGRAPAAFMNESASVSVFVDDEPEVFLEMLKFVYLNTCHVDHSNIKALMIIADKYGIEAIIVYCMQWMQNHFTASLFYNFLTFDLKNAHFRELMLQSFLLALQSRRNFILVTEDEVAKWDKLPVSFVEALLSSDELPVASEAEVLGLLARWARGKLARLGQGGKVRSSSTDDEEFPYSPGGSLSPRSSDYEDMERTVSSGTGGTSGAGAGACAGSGAVVGPCVAEAIAGCGGSVEDASAGGSGGSRERGNSTDQAALRRTSMEARQVRSDMVKLLRAFRTSEMAVKMSDLEPVLRILQLTNLFSHKPPRMMTSLDPGFMIYRGVAGVNTPTPLGEMCQPLGSQPNVVQEAWRGSTVSLGCRDWLQQKEGFKLRHVAEGEVQTFPRLRVKIMNSCWSHREKRSSKPATNHPRHTIREALASEMTSSSGEQALAPLAATLPMSSVNESGVQPAFWLHSQDDWEIGRTRSSAPSRPISQAVPNLTDNEKIDHRVICAVMSGQMQQGIRISQRERAGIYDIEELYGQCDEVSLGGQACEVEFELQLTVKAPDHCGICCCALAVLPAGAPAVETTDTLLEMVFNVSVEEPLHFHISSAYFDSNSSYSVALNWVLRPGLKPDAS